jgi:cyanate permease
MLNEDWLQAWRQAGHSLLNMELMLLWLGTMALRTKSIRNNKWGRVSSILQITGFPVGLVASILANNSDASRWGLIPLALAFVFTVIFIVTLSPEEREAIRIIRREKWKAFTKR